MNRLGVASYSVSIHILLLLKGRAPGEIACKSKNVTNNHHAINSNVSVDIITFIRHFLLVASIPAICFHPIPLEFYLPYLVLLLSCPLTPAPKL